MKALAVKQPFAGLIASGQKTLEIRKRYLGLRGPKLIKSSLIDHSKGWYLDYVDYSICPMERGYALCVVDMVDCRLMTPNDETAACHEYIEGHFVYVYENVRKIEPFYVKGQVGIFNVDDSLIQYKKG